MKISNRYLTFPRFTIRFLFMIVVIQLFCGSCKKFVEIPPPKTEITNANVFTDEGTATAAVTGIYSRMMASTGFASGNFYSLSSLTGLYADELIDYSSGTNVQFYHNNLSSGNGLLGSSLWSEPYQYIYTANNILEGLNSSNSISGDVKNELIGEARFIRAFCYFYLVNLYDAVPLDTITDYHTNAVLTRSPVTDIYRQVISDLTVAQQLLPEDYTVSLGERVRPNKWVATALLARVNLYLGNWSSAIDQSSSIINNNALYQLVSLDSVFLKNSTETIWQLVPVIPGFNTNEGQLYILSGRPVWYSLSSEILQAFENNDQRRVHWIDSIIITSNTFYFPFKYKLATGADLQEYSMVLRLAEQYLIRSEARAWLGDLTGSASDLNKIRNRAGLQNITAADQDSLLTAILHERQVELFTEWGHRWLDLKRTGQAGPVLSLIKSGWKQTDSLFPIPQLEIQNNFRITQNPGY